MSARKWRSACFAAVQVATLATAAVTYADEPPSSPPSPDAPLLNAPPPLPNSAPAQVPALPPPLQPSIPEAVTTAWPNGKLSSIRCGTEPITRSLCRYGDFTGMLLTYHPDGSASQVLALLGGLLEGLAESYDAQGHLLSRELFHEGKLVPSGPLPTEITLRADPPLPPPQTVSTQTQVETVPRITMAPSDDEALRGLVGIGVRGSLGFVASSAVTPFYVGGLFQVIPNSGRVRPEFGAGVMYAVKQDYRRVDIPLSVGVQGDLFPGADALYLVAAASAVFARRTIPNNVPGPSSESAVLLGGEGGIGVRLHHSATSYWLFDLRMGGLGRVDSAARILLPQADGPPTTAIGSQFRMMVSLGFIGNLGS